MAEQQLYKIELDSCPTPVLLVSSNGEIVQANRRLEQLFGYDLGELIGNSVEILVPTDIRPIHPELRDAYFEIPTPRRMGSGR
jgi:PAS domain S-box-containing protein